MYIINTYLPSFLLVLLSWLSFYIDPEATPARTSLGAVIILTITTQRSTLTNSMPPGSTTNAIDVWMFTCLFYVFGALVEYAAINTLARRRRQRVNAVFDLNGKCQQANESSHWRTDGGQMGRIALGGTCAGVAKWD